MRRFIAITALLAACSSTVTTTEPLLDAAATAPPTNAPTTANAPTTPPDTSPAPPLVPAGCATWDAAALTELSPIDNELALLEDTSTPDKLVCNFVGVSDLSLIHI